MNAEEEESIEAVNRYIRGDKPSNICRDAGRSEKWLFNWVNRFKTGEEEWYKSRSRAPQKHGKRIRKELENTVVNVRNSLMRGNEHESKYLGVSADAVQYRMEKPGFSREDMPSVSTIKRIVKNHGLIANKRERYKRVNSKKRYTILNPTKVNEMHQMDFVGPRFIKGYGAVSSLNLIDVVRNRIHIEQYDSRTMDNIIDFLTRYWRNNPIPRYLQVDNGMYFIGDFKYPRGFSRFLRFCLYAGVEVVFINPTCPWMNGSIENFNGWFDEKFWAKELFTNLENMLAKSPHFIDQYNDLSAWKHKNQALEWIKPLRILNNSIGIPLRNYHLPMVRYTSSGRWILKEKSLS
ncbi:Integrase core domain-containing protein [Candidatus Methanophagaceae archaeon]|nr:Integrase core domain-containing protein [Methanophagales archaeon]